MSETNLNTNFNSGGSVPPIDESELQGAGATEETEETSQTGMGSGSSITQSSLYDGPDFDALPPLTGENWQDILGLLLALIKRLDSEMMETDLDREKLQHLELSTDAMAIINGYKSLDRAALADFSKIADKYPELAERAANGDPVAIAQIADAEEKAAEEGKGTAKGDGSGFSYAEISQACSAQRKLMALQEYEALKKEGGDIDISLLLDKFVKDLTNQMRAELMAIITSLFADDTDSGDRSVRNRTAFEAAEQNRRAAADEALADRLVEDMIKDDEEIQSLEADDLKALKAMLRKLVQLLLASVSAFAAKVAVPDENISEEKLAAFSGDVGGKIEVLRNELDQLKSEHPEMAQLLSGTFEYVQNSAQIQALAKNLMLPSAAAANMIRNGAGGGGTVQLPIVG